MRERPGNSEPQGINYDAIFEEEKAKIIKEYPGSNLMPGSREVEAIHDRTNKRAIVQALNIAFDQRGLKVPEMSINILADAYVEGLKTGTIRE